jgi:hypothetical protein
MKSEALLGGRIFDDRGNRMSPSHARKRGIKYRYYLSAAVSASACGQYIPPISDIRKIGLHGSFE